jgi:hypothetical protein
MAARPHAHGCIAKLHPPPRASWRPALQPFTPAPLQPPTPPPVAPRTPSCVPSLPASPRPSSTTPSWWGGQGWGGQPWCLHEWAGNHLSLPAHGGGVGSRPSAATQNGRAPHRPLSQVAEEMRQHMADMGFRTVDEMIGRADMLEPNTGGGRSGPAPGRPVLAASCQPPPPADGASSPITALAGVDDTSPPRQGNVSPAPLPPTQPQPPSPHPQS